IRVHPWEGVQPELCGRPEPPRRVVESDPVDVMRVLDRQRVTERRNDGAPQVRGIAGIVVLVRIRRQLARVRIQHGEPVAGGLAVDCVSRYQSAPNVSPRLSGSKNRAGLNTRSVGAWVGNGPVRSRSKSWGVVSFGSNTSRLTMCVVSWLNVRTPLPMKRIESDSAGGGTQNSLRP